MESLQGGKDLTGYKVRAVRRGSFRVRGYSIVAPPGRKGEAEIPRLWDAVISDGRLAKLRTAAGVSTSVLGLGSWDPECPKGGQRYTICIEETDRTDFGPLAEAEGLFSKTIGASEWLCFETVHGEQYPGSFWKDDPYKMMCRLGYGFHTAPDDYSVGLHFELYPPDFSFGEGTNKAMEFWITVVRSSPAQSGPRGG